MGGEEGVQGVFEFVVSARFATCATKQDNQLVVCLHDSYLEEKLIR